MTPRVLLLLALLQVAPATAGVPLWRDGTGQPVRRAMPLVFHLDAVGPSSAEGAFLASVVAEAAATWTRVGTAAVRFQPGARLPQNVDATNYESVVGVCYDDLNPIVWDTGGQLLDRLFGTGTSEELLGVTIPDCDPELDGRFETTIVLNGALIGGSRAGPYAMALATLVHELGHALNLAHSRLNGDLVENGDAADDVFLPTMFPFPGDDPIAAATLTLDDRATLSLLYPAPSFLGTTGTLAGLGLIGDAGRPVSGTEIAIRSTDDPRATAIWTITGMQPVDRVGDARLHGPFAPNTAGAFQASGLPEGDYTVVVEGGASGEMPEGYAGAGETGNAATDPPEVAVPVHVAAGRARTDVMIRLDERTPAAYANTEWQVTWRGRLAIPGGSLALPPDALPADGRLRLLSTGGVSFDTAWLFDGPWTPRGSRRYRATPQSPELVLDLARSFFKPGKARLRQVAAGGRHVEAKRKLKGFVQASGRLLVGDQPPLKVRWTYRGVAVGAALTPGMLPPISTVRVRLSTPTRLVLPGGQVAFDVAVEGAPTDVTWAVEGPGSVDAAGVYAAPNDLMEPTMVVVTAASAVDPRASGRATLLVASAGTVPAPLGSLTDVAFLGGRAGLLLGAEAGDDFVLATDAPSGCIDFEVRDTTNAVVDFGYCMGGLRHYVFEAPGPYLLLFETSGSVPYFRMRLERTRDPVGALALPLGTWERVPLSRPIDVPVFTFDGAAGDRVEVRTACPSYCNVDVYDPAGRLVGYEGGFDIATLTVDLDSDGRHAVFPEAEAFFFDPGTLDVGVIRTRNVPGAVSLQPGIPEADTLASLAETDAYTVAGVAGSTLHVEFATGGFQPCVRIFDSAGAAIALDCEFSTPTNGALDVQLAASGDFTVLVGTRDDPGSYTVTASTGP